MRKSSFQDLVFHPFSISKLSDAFSYNLKFRTLIESVKTIYSKPAEYKGLHFALGRDSKSFQINGLLVLLSECGLLWHSYPSPDSSLCARNGTSASFKFFQQDLQTMVVLHNMDLVLEQWRVFTVYLNNIVQRIGGLKVWLGLEN